MKKSELRKLIREIIKEQNPGHPCQNATQACCEKCHTAGWTDGVTNLSPSDPCYEATSDPEFGIAACKCCMSMEERWTCTATAVKYPGHYSDTSPSTLAMGPGATWQDNPMGDAIPIGGQCVSSFGKPDWPYASLEECEAAGCGADTDSGGGITINPGPVNPAGMPTLSKNKNRRIRRINRR